MSRVPPETDHASRRVGCAVNPMKGSISADVNGRSKSVERRRLPAVEKMLRSLGSVDLPRATLVALVREELGALRREENVPEEDVILEKIRSACARLNRLRLQPVINGTGIVLHTNLGRAPLGAAVVEHLASIATSYNNIEYDLSDGERGGRAAYLESSLALLSGAEAATVVNNCAAALVLVVRHFTREKPEVVISRGELIQIGGGFRIPEILEASGAQLREVGTTNKTSLSDYASALNSRTGLILKVHRSNFVMAGFVESPSTRAIAALAREKRLPLIEDLGSGAAIRTERIPGLEHEPTPGEILQEGASLVTFSGDKLLGGPQAGILAGKRKLIAALKREPFFRALRCDKLILAALEATVDLYLQGKSEDSIPLLAMLRTSESELHRRAERLIKALDVTGLAVHIGKSSAQVGGGSLPRSTIPSVTLNVTVPQCSPAELSARLRLGSPPVLGYVSGGCVRIDLRTVFPEQDEPLVKAIKAAAP
ncbi:MAG TPA: L-seryl-tRNA(Sec) selenium transferase [Verrucomicrobiae bacterium]|nr:L-seryl-tRNA(Sec) selenium transferase [Verrucomicrobiae bacterium]